MKVLIGFILFFVLLFLAFLAGVTAAFLQLSGQHQLLVLFAIGTLIYAAISARLWAWLNAAAKDCGGYHQLPFAALFLVGIFGVYGFYEAKSFVQNNLTNDCGGFCRVLLVSMVLGFIAFACGSLEVGLVFWGLAALAGATAAFYKVYEAVPHDHLPDHLT